jgi:hypothetical protein
VDQGGVALGTQHPAQPQAGRYLPGQRHPEVPILGGHAHFIGLHLAPVAGLLHEVLLDRFTMPPRRRNPLAHGARVQLEGDDRGFGAAMGHQRDNLGDQSFRILFTIEGRVGAGTKGATTEGAAVALLALTMNGHVALAGVAPGGTGRIGAKYLVRVHGGSPELQSHEILPNPRLFVSVLTCNHDRVPPYRLVCSAAVV